MEDLQLRWIVVDDGEALRLQDLHDHITTRDLRRPVAVLPLHLARQIPWRLLAKKLNKPRVGEHEMRPLRRDAILAWCLHRAGKVLDVRVNWFTAIIERHHRNHEHRAQRVILITPFESSKRMTVWLFIDPKSHPHATI